MMSATFRGQRWGRAECIVFSSFVMLHHLTGFDASTLPPGVSKKYRPQVQRTCMTRRISGEPSRSLIWYFAGGQPVNPAQIRSLSERASKAK
eukprot:2104676-Prymnesium_polylepis.1